MARVVEWIDQFDSEVLWLQRELDEVRSKESKVYALRLEKLERLKSNRDWYITVTDLHDKTDDRDKKLLLMDEINAITNNRKNRKNKYSLAE